MMRVPPVVSALVLTLVAGTATAAPLTVVNHGFEDSYYGGNLPVEFDGDVPATAFPVGDAPNGWDPYGAVGGNAFIGVLNPGVMAVIPQATNFPAGAPEGENVALAFFGEYQGGGEFGIQQTLADTLQPNTLYTLSVQVGNIASGTSVVEPFASFGFFDLRGFPGYRVDLLAGGAVIAQDNSTLLPGEGEFQLSTVHVAIGDSHAQLNQPLTIRLVNLNQQDLDIPVVDLEVDFDDVQLTAVPLAEADFDQDGDVDDQDLATWESAYSVDGTGDTDDDGDSDGEDFLRWQRQFTGGSGLVLAVPEPSAALLCWCCLLGVLAGRRRCPTG
jgi:hypothetical protein